MSTPLRTLILEDTAADAELMMLHVERAGFAPRWQRVETEREFTAALGPEVDRTLADYSLPHYDALRALARVRECGLEAPFLIVSATVGEELAMEAMRQGAADFVIKDRLARLGPAVAHALEQRRLLVENRQAREALQRNEDLSRRIIAAAGELQRLVPLLERLSAQAHEPAVTPGELAAVDTAAAPLRAYLDARTAELAASLNQFPASGFTVPRSESSGHVRESLLLVAMQDTIRVLEQTKRSFKSQALGQLRERLEAVIRAQGLSH